MTLNSLTCDWLARDKIKIAKELAIFILVALVGEDWNQLINELKEWQRFSLTEKAYSI